MVQNSNLTYLPNLLVARIIAAVTKFGFIVVFFCLCTLVVPVSVTEASSWGSVWVTNVTDNSITIDWSNPNNVDYRYPSGTPKFKICYKEAGSWNGACSQGTVIYTYQKPYTLTGLQCNEKYKIKVLPWVEKDRWIGGWSNPDYRLVNECTQSTNACPPPAIHHGNIRVTGSTSSSLDVEVTWSHPADFAMMRVGYKILWGGFSLHYECRNYNRPYWDWLFSDPARGWSDITPVSNVMTITLPNLKSKHRYILVAYGFTPGLGTSVLVGQTKASTDSKKGQRLRTETYLGIVAPALSANHEEVLESYISDFNAFYPGPIFDHVADLFPELVAERDSLEADGDSLNQDFTVMQWLIDYKDTVFNSWQSDNELVAAGLRMDQWLKDTDSTLYQVLLDEAFIQPGQSVPTLTEWGMIILGILLMGGIVWFIWRQRRNPAIART